jgi:hypothetical protein
MLSLHLVTYPDGHHCIIVRYLGIRRRYIVVWDSLAIHVRYDFRQASEELDDRNHCSRGLSFAEVPLYRGTEVVGPFQLRLCEDKKCLLSEHYFDLRVYQTTGGSS